MTGRRRATRAGLAGLVGVALLAGGGLVGCGVPTSSGVELVGPGPAAGSSLRSEGEPPPSADDAVGPEELVDNFLEAAAGTPDTAVGRVREYIHSDERDGWRPDEVIRVVRLRGDPFINDDVNGGWVVQMTVELVGELHANGYLDAPTTVEPVQYEFRIVTEGGPDDGQVGTGALRLRIADPPPHLLLRDTALANEDYFYPNPIYFWDTDHEVLVPDLRWLPLAGESVEQRPWTVIRWLLAGPAPGMPRMEGLPAGSQHNGLPVWDDDRLVVNFNAAAVEGGQADLQDFATQLAWSLPQVHDGTQLELRIDDRPQEVQPRPRPERTDPARFVVLDGVVLPHAPAGIDPPAVPPALSQESNAGVRAAAFTSRGEVAALVRELPDGRQELSVARALAGAEPTEESTGLVAEAIGQPVWLSGSGTASGLVVADGQLYRFGPTGKAGVLSISGLTGPITAAAVSPEQRRLAVIAAGRLYVAQLRHDRDTATVQAPRMLPVTVDSLAGVAFTHEHQLVIVGEKDDRVGLHRVTVDGAVESPLHDLSNATVTGLVAHPVPGLTDLPILMYEANGQAYTFGGVANLIRVDELVDPPELVESPPRAPSFLG